MTEQQPGERQAERADEQGVGAADAADAAESAGSAGSADAAGSAGSADATRSAATTGSAESVGAVVGGDEIEGSAAEPRRRLATKARRRTALVLVLVLAGWAGGWFRAWSDHGLTSAQADQATVRLTLDGFPLGQSNGCDQLGGTQAALQIPLHNYGPGPVLVRSVSVDPPGQAPGAAQATGLTIPAGGSTTVEALIPIQLCTAHQSVRCPNADVVLDATIALVPRSGRVHDLRLPIAAWVPGKSLQLYEDAPFAAWDSSQDCQ